LHLLPLRLNGLGPHRQTQSSTRNWALATALIVLCVANGCSNSQSDKSSGPVFSNASLHGNYMYTLSGSSFSANGTSQYKESGSFVADGNGNITGGVDDFVQNSNLSTSQPTGTYKIASDGTGTVTLALNRGTVQFALSLISPSSFYMMEFDSSASGDGEGTQQTTDAFSATPNGTLIFRLSSSSGNNALGAVVSVGQMMIESGSITGTEDFVRAGVPGSSAITGSITAPDANGRGTAVLNDDSGTQSDYIYYVIDSENLKFLQTDAGSLGEGRADAQSGTFSNASLSSGFVFWSRGSTLSQSFGANSAGAFVGDGNGNIVSGSYDAVLDGTPVSNTSLTGTYQVDPNGRATITLTPAGASPIQLIVWMVDSSYALLLVNTSNLAAVGRLDQQQGSPFSADSLNGSYAFYMFGSEMQSSPWLTRVGVMSFDGNGTVTFSDYFVNTSGVTQQKGPLTGNYSVSANGRVTAFTVGVVNTQVIYLVSNASGSLLLGASGSALAGNFNQQAPP
jgi:hypothetical protein